MDPLVYLINRYFTDGLERPTTVNIAGTSKDKLLFALKFFRDRGFHIYLYGNNMTLS